MRTDAAPAQTWAYRLKWRTMMMALVLLTSAFSIAGLALPPAAAQAATVTVDQCNGHGPSAAGATTAMTCTVTVVNTVSDTTSSSTTTVTRKCTLGPCSSPNGTFTTRSNSLVTAVRQCNGADNDSAHPINCDVTITNDISANTASAQPLTAATVNQCVGSGTGGGGREGCSPFPATNTGATVTQCNGSGNGGGGTVHCAVGPKARVSPAIPITVSQCNGTGNAGGSVVTCRTSLITNITDTAATTRTRTATPTATRTATPTPTATRTATPSQTPRVLSGEVQTGGGSTTGRQRAGQLMLGAGLLLAAAISALLGWRAVQRDKARDGVTH